MRKSLIVLILLVTACGGVPAAPVHPSPPVAAPRTAPPTDAPAARPARWRITERGAEHEIEGYADRVSVLPGERFRMRVSTTAPHFTASAFRMGARPAEVWRSGRIPGVHQAPPQTVEGMVTAAHWTPSLTVDTTGWREGAYLVRLDASTGGQRYVPITVRSASTTGRVVLVNAVTTWQAYNLWGGRSLYQGPGGFDGRSRKVTFDRPYDTSGARLFLDFERSAIAVAERSGVPLAYLTSLDLRPGVLDGARAVVSLGHDEYWSPGMRAAVTRARDAGTNLAFLGANAVYWRIGLYGRMIMCDKESQCPLWRASTPESELVGQQYDCFPPRPPTWCAGPATGSSREPGAAASPAWRASRRTRCPPIRRRTSRCWPIRRSTAAAGRRSPTAPTTRLREGPGCSPRARCAGCAGCGEGGAAMG
ncbi:MAG TPA: N,N-dimethylformamidase beta subunit family domain-containing protein [Nonomuraea sp.]|nr:N,N-dimethylformamidase beta subunit family domain-containing protein [Nonomuraea sp.]